MPPKKPAGERYGTSPPPPPPKPKTPMDYQGEIDETGRYVWTGVNWRRTGRSPFASGFQGCFGVGATVLLVLAVLLYVALYK